MYNPAPFLAAVALIETTFQNKSFQLIEIKAFI